jgi:hypothetical protein
MLSPILFAFFISSTSLLSVQTTHPLGQALSSELAHILHHRLEKTLVQASVPVKVLYFLVFLRVIVSTASIILG